MNNYKQHQELLKKCFLEVQRRLTDARIFERHIGLFDRPYGKGKVKIGIKGQSDAHMYWRGKVFEIEFKTGQAKQTKEQKHWQRICGALDVPYVIIRSVKEMNEFIDDVIRGDIEKHICKEEF